MTAKISKWLGLALLLAVVGARSETLTEADKFIERANKFVKENSLPRAKGEYLKALNLSPKNLDALYNLAVVCERLGQNDEAIAHYKHYLELAPNDPDAWTQL